MDGSKATSVVEVLPAGQWVKDHGSIVGYPMECKSNPGQFHPLIKFTRKRYNAQMSVFRTYLKPTTFRVSQDIAHMLVGNRQSAASFGHTLICDPSLEPDTIIEPHNG